MCASYIVLEEPRSRPAAHAQPERYAAIATNGQLEPYDEGISYVIKTDKSILDGMDEW